MDKVFSVMESGAVSYRAEHNWGNLPPHILWGMTNAVVIDRGDRAFIGHTSRAESPCKDTIVIFNREGEYIDSWGARFEGHLHGLTLNVEEGVEYLYVVDDQQGVFKCALDGEVLFHWGKPEIYTDNGWTFGPANVVVRPNGDLFVAEGYGEAFVLHFNAEGELLNRFGGRKPGRDSTNWAHGIAVREFKGEELLHIACDEPSEIRRFTFDGEYHSTVELSLNHPRGIYGHADCWIIPEMQCRLTLHEPGNGRTVRLGDWNKTMEEVFELRALPTDKMPVGAFCSAHGAAVFSDGTLLVSEWVEHGRLTVLTPTQGK